MALLDQIKYFPDIKDEDFYQKIYDKAEFSLMPNRLRAPGHPKQLLQIEPHQLFVKNFLSPHTPYNGLLLFFGTGSGKTCASLKIAEQLRPHVAAQGGRIIVLGTNAEHVKDIFEKEMYYVHKEVREMYENIPPGSSHCLGDQYYSGDATRLLDENSFSVSVKRSEKTVGNIYEFYGFRQFHTKVSKLEANGQFLNKYFANCIFIVDEAHNLSGLEPKSEVTGIDESMSATSEMPHDDQITLNAERIRNEVINLKRNITENRLKCQDHLVKYTQNQLPSHLESVKNLEHLNKELTERYDELRESLLRILTEQLSLDDVITEWLAEKLLVSGRVHLKIDDLYGKGYGTETITTLSQSKILSFLIEIQNTSGFQNIYPSFLREITGKGEGRIDGLKAYQAIKRVILSLGGTKVILLSATPMRDRPDSIVNLINILRLNDGNSELTVPDLFDAQMRVREAEMAAAVTGYVSRYSPDTSDYPPVYWDLARHPNRQDRELLGLVEPFTLKLNSNHRLTPTLTLLGCRSKPGSAQDQEYSRYLRYMERPSDGKSSLAQLEFRCSLAIPLTKNQIVEPQLFEEASFEPDFDPETGTSQSYLMRYKMRDFYKQIFRFDVRGDQAFNFSYLDEKKTGRFLDLDQVGQYSAKLETLVRMLNAVAVREEESGGLNLIYSKSTYFGCYPIALVLENMGYRRYPRGSMWQNPPQRKLCSICNQFEGPDHPSDDHAFKQAYYLLAVGSSEEVNKYKSVLMSKANSYGELIKVVVGTKTITEGIDFKFIRYIHVFEPWYNFTRLDQLAGRGSRKGSHLDLPAPVPGTDDYQWRNVSIFLYCYLHSQTRLSCLEPQASEGALGELCSRGNYLGGCNFTKDIDNYLVTLEKDCKIKQVERILNRQAIDCPLYVQEDTENEVDQFTRKCYYNRCGLDCQYLPPSLRLVTRDGELYLQTSDNQYALTQQTTLKELGFQNKLIVGAKSGSFYLHDQPFLSQLVNLGDWPKSDDRNISSRVVAWRIDPKDYSTFYLLFFESMAKELVKVLKFTLIRFYQDQPIIKLSNLVKRLQTIISYSIEPTILTKLVDYTMSLMSGVYRPKEYALPNYIIIPLAVGAAPGLTADTYYVLHPDRIQHVDSTLDHKYIWPQMVSKRPTDIDWSKWIVPPPLATESTSSELTPGQISGEIGVILQDYLKELNNHRWNKYEMYDVFMTHYRFADTVKYARALSDPYYKPTYILDQLITNKFESSFDEQRVTLIKYLAHYLEYNNYTKILACDCQNALHWTLPKPAGVQFQFVFGNPILLSGKMNVQIDEQNQVTYQRLPDNYIIQPYEQPFYHGQQRTESPIAFGDYDHAKSGTNFRVKNWLAIAQDLKKGKALRSFRQCATIFMDKSTQQETDEDPGLVKAYEALIRRIHQITPIIQQERPIPNVRPDLWVVKVDHTSNTPYQAFLYNEEGALIDSKAMANEKDFKQDFFCEQFRMLLHYLNDYDPQHYYFKYYIAPPKEPGSTTKKASKKGRKKKAA